MQPTDVLRREHRVIEQVLSCLEKLADGCDRQGKLDPSLAEGVLDFFRNFADRCHHGKEEEHLFPALEAKGFPQRGGPTGVMLSEHEQGRLYVRCMAAALDRAAEGDGEALRAFAGHARAFVGLLREHIAKEDHCLFPMAEQALDADERQELLEAFEHVEHEDLHAGDHERYLRLADDLADRLGVPHAEPDPEELCCSCLHAAGYHPSPAK